jgi:hypothetical protein
MVNINYDLNFDLISDIKAELELIETQLGDSYEDSFINGDYNYMVVESDIDDIFKTLEYNYSPHYIDDLVPLTWQDMKSLLQVYMSDEQILELLLDSCSIKAVGYHCVYNEFYSVILGGEIEAEINVSDYTRLESLINQASDEDLKYLEIDRSSFLRYPATSQRIVWTVDTEILYERLLELKSAA